MNDSYVYTRYTFFFKETPETNKGSIIMSNQISIPLNSLKYINCFIFYFIYVIIRQVIINIKSSKVLEIVLNYALKECKTESVFGLQEWSLWSLSFASGKGLLQSWLPLGRVYAEFPQTFWAWNTIYFIYLMIEEMNINNHQGEKLTTAVLVGKCYTCTNARMQSPAFTYQTISHGSLNALPTEATAVFFYFLV